MPTLIRAVVCGLVGVLAWPAPAPGAAAGSLVIEPAHAQAAPVFQQEVISSAFTVTNTGTGEVTGLRAVVRSGAGSLSEIPTTLAPGESATFEYRYPVGAALGLSTQRLALFTDEPGVDRYRFTLTAFVLNAFEPEGAVLDFGAVDVQTAPQRSVEIATREAERWAMTGVESAPDFVDVDLSERSVSVKLRPGAPPGPLMGEVVVRTDVAAQPLLVLPLRGYAIGRLLPEATGIGFNRIEVGQTEERSIAIRLRPADKTQRPLSERLQIESVEGLAHTRLAECPGEVATCARLTLTAKPESDGPFSGQVRVRLDGEHSEPATPIAYSGFAMQAGVEPRRIQVDDELAAATARPATFAPVATGSAASAAGVQNVIPADAASPSGASSALVEGDGDRQPDHAEQGGSTSTASPESSGPEDFFPTVRWAVSKEGNVYGYSVYRSTDRAGPYVRVGEPVIPVASGNYEFTDTSAEPGAEYYYFVDAVSVRGQRVRLTPTLRKVTAIPDQS